MQELSAIEKRVLVALGKIGDVATPEQLLESSGLRELVQVMNLGRGFGGTPCRGSPKRDLGV